MANQFTKRVAMAKTDDHRAKIQTSMLINRLWDHVCGKVEMTPTQVAAAKALFNKVLPDLQATQISGEVDHNYVTRMPDPVTTPEAWQEQHAPKRTIQ